jgi:RNA polymerase sigma-70 factor (ECF subfamily)
VAWSSGAPDSEAMVRPLGHRRAAAAEDSFQEFYLANYWRIAGLVAAVLGSRAEAEDVAQEAFSRALVRWPRIASYDLPDAWVRRVALRLAIDSARRVRRAARLVARVAADPVGPAGNPGDPLDPLPSTRLTAALLRVPLPQREVLVLHYLADLPVDAIAQDRGLSPGTVKTRLAAGRRRLELELAQPEESEDA